MQLHTRILFSINNKVSTTIFNTVNTNQILSSSCRLVDSLLIFFLYINSLVLSITKYMYMASSSTSLVFKVQRLEPELITPAKPTPHEFKYLSDIDDQQVLRFQIPFIHFYRKNDVSFASGKEKDPVDVIRKAIADALVFYYPFAGRLVEAPGRKLVVECNGKGVMFIEADADVRLDEFGDALQPPFPCLEELLFDVPGSAGVLNCPLLLIQVTRLKCGGFILAIRLNHTMSDAQGLVQFMTALGEISRGAPSPSILPVWHRHILTARDPPQATYPHREYDVISDTKHTLIPLDDDMVQHSFFFGPQELAALRKHVSSQCTTFELLTACLWRCRTIAISPDPEEEVRMICIVNVRGKFDPPIIPQGFYGNAFGLPVAISTAEELCKNPLGHALELVKKAKRQVTREFMRSLANFMVENGRPHLAVVRLYLVSDVTRVGLGDVDFGWGEAVYGGLARVDVRDIPGVSSFYIPFKNSKGEDGILVPICLGGLAMKKFVVEIEKLINNELIC
ncbi:hypothetical protein MKX01_012793 [Papaver californicum]|nr:hypothetical protein MKX01_012793 [Papaver californicum]